MKYFVSYVSICGTNHTMKVYWVTILSVLKHVLTLGTRSCLILQTSLIKCLYLIFNQIVKTANQIYKNCPPFSIWRLALNCLMEILVYYDDFRCKIQLRASCPVYII